MVLRFALSHDLGSRRMAVAFDNPCENDLGTGCVLLIIIEINPEFTLNSYYYTWASERHNICRKESACMPRGLGEAEHLFCLSTKNKQMFRLSEAQKSVLMLDATNVGPLRGLMYSSMQNDLVKGHMLLIISRINPELTLFYCGLVFGFTTPSVGLLSYRRALVLKAGFSAVWTASRC